MPEYPEISRMCLKIAFWQMCVTICGTFVENAENIIGNKASTWNRMFQSSKNGEKTNKVKGGISNISAVFSVSYRNGSLLPGKHMDGFLSPNSQNIVSVVFIFLRISKHSASGSEDS